MAKQQAIRANGATNTRSDLGSAWSNTRAEQSPRHIRHEAEEHVPIGTAGEKGEEVMA